MKKSPTVFNPLGLYAIAAQASLDMAKSYQEAMSASVERAAARPANMVEWVRVDVPVVNMKAYFDEAQMRDAFHALADANLRGWETAAQMLQEMPNWMFWGMRVPGPMLTDWFDRMKRAAETAEPTTDAWAAMARLTGRVLPKTDAPKAKPAARRAGPPLLDAPIGQPDDLTAIKGIGPKLSATLNELGIYHYHQIAKWTAEECDWIDDKLAFKGRVEREQWVEQAQALGSTKAA